MTENTCDFRGQEVNLTGFLLHSVLHHDIRIVNDYGAGNKAFTAVCDGREFYGRSLMDAAKSCAFHCGYELVTDSFDGADDADQFLEDELEDGFY